MQKSAVVKVTQELIDKGHHRADDCPVFDAMTAAGVPVAVLGSWDWVDKNHRTHEHEPAVRQWIIDYDFRRVMQPFEFTVTWEE